MCEPEQIDGDVRAPLRLALVGGAYRTREALSELLSEQPDTMVVAQAQDLDAVMVEARQSAPNLVLVDFKLPEVDTILACREFRGEFPGCGIVLQTTHAHAGTVAAVVMASAAGHIAKTLDGVRLTRALAMVHQSDSPDRRVGAGVVRWYEAWLRNRRGGGVDHSLLLLQLIASGRSDHEISQQLNLGTLAVRSEVARLYRTLVDQPDFRAPGSDLARLLL